MATNKNVKSLYEGPSVDDGMGSIYDREQLPQAPEDQHGPGYSNLVPDNWLRGMPGESAEGKPGFDKSESRLGHVKPIGRKS